MKRITLLGSTGSVGTQTLELVANRTDLQVIGLSANRNIDLLEAQIKQFKPQMVAVMDLDQAEILSERLKTSEFKYDCMVVGGIQGLIQVATLEAVDMVVTAVVGMIGLRPTIAAIEAGKDIALANKETLVTAGELIIPLCQAKGVRLLPVDSEHSAIFQCLNGEKTSQVESLILTASGGPFLGKKKSDLEQVTLEDALKHPNWSMGSKISIDSATLMNKGLEVIEGRWLFGVLPDAIKVCVHPESIIHSMVAFIDGSVMAQLGLPDMVLPIQYALFYPERVQNDLKRLDLPTLGRLTFYEPDTVTFPCLDYAYEALSVGGTMPTVLNAANEKAVSLFMAGKIKFLDIERLIRLAMDHHETVKPLSIEAILEAERWSHAFVESRC